MATETRQTKTYHSDAMRRHYAARFNTYDHLVCWWDELTPDQRAQAIAQFSGFDMDAYAYELATYGNVIARCKRSRYDSN